MPLPPQPPTDPSYLYPWLRLLPYPAAVVSKGDELLFANTAMGDLLRQLKYPADRFDPDWIMTVEDRRRLLTEASADSKQGRFVSKRVTFGSGPTTFQLNLSCLTGPDGRPVCCILLMPPGSDAPGRHADAVADARQTIPEILTADPAMLTLLQRVDRVAVTDTTVLITGETGTGKDLIARRLHWRSRRAHRPLVRIDCGSLSEDQIESELFGYRKGAFDGTQQSKIGRFEAADGGTIFLDAIGEMPMALQTRLLRVLQDGFFTPVGAGGPVHTDVRIIAASSRDLADDIAAGKFRADLFFRLNVFPVYLPPLRERPGDVEVLLWHFIRKHRFGGKARAIESLGDGTLELLQAYSFPGNVRELENLTRSALLSTRGNVLQRIDFSIQPVTATTPPHAIEQHVRPLEVPSLEDVQREHIRQVLQLTNGRVSGPHGAARLLDIKPQTLYGRMRKLGLR